MSVLITGGAGFIGSNLADAVVGDGRPCHVVDNLTTGQAIRVPGEAELHELDIRDGAGLAALAESAKPTVIFHLAAQADVRRALEDPGYDADVNVIDFDDLTLPQPEFVHDLPNGAGRYIQGSSGYDYTIVNGQIFMDHGAHTGALTGRVVRSHA